MATGRTLSELKPKPRDDAYTVLLIISLLAMIGACVLLFYDLKRYPSPKPSQDYARPPSASPAPGLTTPEPPSDPMPPMPDPNNPAPEKQPDPNNPAPNP